MGVPPSSSGGSQLSFTCSAHLVRGELARLGRNVEDVHVARGLEGPGLANQPDCIFAGISGSVSLWNAKNSISFGVDSIFRVEFDGCVLVVIERSSVSDPLCGGGRLAAEPQVVADGTALLQRDVVDAV